MNKTLNEYILEYEKENDFYGCFCYINTKNEPDIQHNIQTICIYDDNFSSTYIPNKQNISPLLKEKKPIKLFYMNDEEFSSIFTKGTESGFIPENKKVLIALFDTFITKENIIEYFGQ